MRLLVLAVLCVITMVIAAPPARAESDVEVDAVELLFQDRPAVEPPTGGSVPSIAGDEPVSALIGPELEAAAQQSAAEPDRSTSSHLTESTLWGVTAAEPSMATHVGGLESADHETEGSAATINAVPEPSAILLAVAALIYFLLFGRRRRVM